jgi:hypothetical protein
LIRSAAWFSNFGTLPLDGVIDDDVFPLDIDMESAGAPDLHVGGDVDKRNRPIPGRGQLCGERRGVVAVRGQIH